MVQIGFVISNTAFCALIPDLIPTNQNGRASAVYGIYGVIGGATGSLP